jgi:hypothetical protein
MNEITSFLSNQWVIGIIEGIISGLIVYFVTKYIFSRGENKEYSQKVLSANHEVIYAIRPSISENHLPTQEIIKNLISSTARKYGIETEDMYSTEQIVDDLIKEVMDSSFISAKTKSEYCDHLLTLKLPEVSSPMEFEQKVTTSTYSQKVFQYTSVLLGITVAVITLMNSLLLNNSSTFSSSGSTLILTVMVILISMFTYFVTFNSNNKKRENNDQVSDTKPYESNE